MKISNPSSNPVPVVTGAALAGAGISTATVDNAGIARVVTAVAPVEAAVAASPYVEFGMPNVSGGGASLLAYRTSLATLVYQLPETYSPAAPVSYVKIRNAGAGSLALSVRLGAAGPTLTSLSVPAGQSAVLTCVPFMTTDTPWVVTAAPFL